MGALQRRRAAGPDDPAAPPVPPRLRKADRKRQILAQAKQLFVTLGYAQTTTAKIAEASGISEPVLYRHFPSKKALFLEVLEEIRSATLQRWQSAADELADPLARLHAIADQYLDTARAHALELRVMHRSLVECDDPEIAAALRAFYLDSESLLARIISDGQQAGVFRRSLDPRVGAWEMIRTALAYSLTAPLDIPLYQEPDYLPQAIDCLLHCLLKTDV